MTKLKNINVKHNTKRNRNKIMKGGRYTQEQRQQLLDAGFNQQFLEFVERLKIGFGFLWPNFEHSGITAQQYMQKLYDELELNPDDGFTDTEDNDDDDDEQNGGKRKKSKKMKTKKRKTKKNKTRKQKRQIKKGGAMFGNGYGANCNDPNYNIYNTNLLKLFPYSTK
jgi:hypothetical protein